MNKVYYTRKDRKEQVIRSVSGDVYSHGLFAFFWPLHLPFCQRQQNRDHNTNL